MAFNKETGMWEGFIYCIENKVNGKKYIGQTIRTIKIRWQDHICNSKKDTPSFLIGKAIKKYGINNFTIKKLCVFSDPNREVVKTNLDRLESEYIINENSLAHVGHGYNLESGGSYDKHTYNPVVVYNLNGKKLNEFNSCVVAANYYGMNYQTIHDICNGEMYNYKNQLVFRWKGDSFDIYPCIYYKKYTVVKYIDSDEEFDPNYKTTTPVDVYNKETSKYIQSFDSISDCAKTLNLSSSSIGSVCRGITKTAGNYIVRYKGEPLNKYDYKHKKQESPKRKVNQYTLDDVFICSYLSIRDVCNVINKPHQHIYDCCNHKQTKAYGYKWFYANDDSQPDKSKIIV